MHELVNTQLTKAHQNTKSGKALKNQSTLSNDKSHKHMLNISSNSLLSLYDDICDYCESLGDDSQRKELKLYTAFKRIKNFASFHVLPQKKDEGIVLY
jgi:uncharacterized protein YaaR (DUF327 family)